MPKIAEIEDTPNPNAVKFILKEPLTWGITHSYDNAGQAQGDALAARRPQRDVLAVQVDGLPLGGESELEEEPGLSFEGLVGVAPGQDGFHGLVLVLDDGLPEARHRCLRRGRAGARGEGDAGQQGDPSVVAEHRILLASS